ncbi:MAG: proline dehydrogenase family protein [Bacteroidales bacterium]
MIKKFIAWLLPYMPKKLVWIFSKRYIAGENLEDAIRISKDLNSQGIRVTIDLLGEFITRLDEAEENKKAYLSIIETVTATGVDGNFSVKPTMFGLLLDKEVCYQNIREIVKKAAEKNTFIRIDMEDSQCVDMEIELLRKLKAEFPAHVGLVVQAYLRRTLSDLQAMMDLHTQQTPLSYRLCKGIYVEPASVAFKGYQEVRDHFVEDLDFMLQKGIYPGIATHDKYLVEEAYKLIEKHKSPKTAYEFQMLYGVTPDLRKSIVEKGHHMRVYVPFGTHWFGYSTRRLKENPNMVWLILKALAFRG